MKDLSLRQVIEQSASRAERWHAGKEPWSPLEWTGAMAGEAGEACNAAKKLKRVTQQMQNLDFREPTLTKDAQDYKYKIAEEVADTILYGVCVCHEIKIDLIPILIAVFNQKSEEYDFPERIG